MNKPPATTGELNVVALIYKRVVSGRDDHGKSIHSYVLRRRVHLKESRQRTKSEVVAHMSQEDYRSILIGNWWDLKDVDEHDIIVYGSQRLQVGLNGKPINWEQRNRWGILNIAASSDCLKEQDIDSCNCQETPPAGTE